MTTISARTERLSRARKELGERGMDALLLGPSADLRYLTGYQAPPLERMTLLVLPAAGDARLVEDTTGKGHTTRQLGNEPCVTATVRTLSAPSGSRLRSPRSSPSNARTSSA